MRPEHAEALRAPFPAAEVGRKGDRPYVGHAEVRDRLLEVDPAWNWSPVALDADGLPALIDDPNPGRARADAPAGRIGLWIRLEVAGVSRLGYGSAERSAAEPVKEAIGDAIKNAALSFGVAIDLKRLTPKARLRGPERPEAGPEATEAAEPAPTEPEAAQARSSTAERLTLSRIRALARAAKVDIDKITAGYGVATLEELTAEQAEQAVASLESRAKPATKVRHDRTGEPVEVPT